MNPVLINGKGELLEILQELRDPQEGEHIVPLDGYYEVFNVQGFKSAKYDFESQSWKGYHEPQWNGTEWVEGASQERLDEIEAEKNKPLPPTQDQRIKDLENMVVGLMDVILIGGM